jgi:hypothetical protein
MVHSHEPGFGRLPVRQVRLRDVIGKPASQVKPVSRANRRNAPMQGADARQHRPVYMA